MSGICPCCGYNLTADEPVERGPWVIDPRRGVFFNGELVVRRQTWTQILLTLARLNGARIPTEALLSRITESENPNVLASQVSQMRAYLRRRGIKAPVACVPGKGTPGYWWQDAA